MNSTKDLAAALGSRFSQEEVLTSIKLFMGEDRGAYERHRDMLVERHLKDAEEIHGKPISAEQFAISLDDANEQLAIVLTKMRIMRAVQEILKESGLDYQVVTSSGDAMPVEVDPVNFVYGSSTPQ